MLCHERLVMSVEAFIDDISLYLGENVPIESTLANRPSDAEMRRLRNGGMISYSELPNDIGRMALPALEQFFARRSRAPEIDTIVVTSGSGFIIPDREKILLQLFQRFGISNVRYVRVAGTFCADAAAALDYAAGLIRRGRAKCALLLSVNRQDETRNRYSDAHGCLLGDGVVACLIQSNEGQFRILDATSQSRVDMIEAMATADKYLRLSRQLIKGAVESLRVTEISQYRHVITANLGKEYLAFVALALGIDVDLVFAENVHRFGHIHECDYLINLASWQARQRPEAVSGQKILICALGKASAGAIALEVA
jgi:3-oxoacyl-[acyl-carrier-protein] synthase III